MIMEELEDEQQWDESFARSPDFLAKHFSYGTRI